MSTRIAQFFLLIFSISSPSASAQQLHAIVVIDTDSNISESVSADLKNLKQVLRNGLPANALQIVELTGRDVRGKVITDTLTNLQIQKDDAVMFYYSGHGGFSPEEGHYLDLHNGGRLLRSSVVQSIKRPLTPRFWAVVTDCCASFPRVAPAPTAAFPPNTTLLTHLFLKTRGRIDITSSRPEQISLGMPPPMGGAFTWSFCHVLESNANKRLDWDDVFESAREETARLTENLMQNHRDPYTHRDIPQRTQTVYSFRTMYNRNVNGLRLGIECINRRITTVRKGSPAERGGLTAGMKVIRVNGHAVSDDNHLVTSVNFSPKNATIDIESNGIEQTIKVELVY